MNGDGFNGVPEVSVEISEPCGDLFAALAKAQGEMKNPERNRENPYFKSRYADLAAITDASRAALAKHGLCVTQWPLAQNGEVGCVTVLGHSSGQKIVGRLLLAPTKGDVQGCGSALTYVKRYSLQAVLNLAADDDDDGNAAAAPQGRPAAQKPASRTTQRPEPAPPQFGDWGMKLGKRLKDRAKADYKKDTWGAMTDVLWSLTHEERFDPAKGKDRTFANAVCADEKDSQVILETWEAMDAASEAAAKEEQSQELVI